MVFVARNQFSSVLVRSRVNLACVGADDTPEAPHYGSRNLALAAALLG